MKLCIICLTELNRSNTTWYRQKNYIHKCTDCIRAEKRKQTADEKLRNPSASLARSAKHREKMREYEPKKYTASQQCASARKRAKALGLPFNLTPEYLSGIQVDMCPVLDIKIKYGGGERCDASATLDRIDSFGGYIVGNVQIISFKANLMKSNATPEEMLAFAEWVYANVRTFEKKEGVANG